MAATFGPAPAFPGGRGSRMDDAGAGAPADASEPASAAGCARRKACRRLAAASWVALAEVLHQLFLLREAPVLLDHSAIAVFDQALGLSGWIGVAAKRE